MSRKFSYGCATKLRVHIQSAALMKLCAHHLLTLMLPVCGWRIEAKGECWKRLTSFNRRYIIGRRQACRLWPRNSLRLDYANSPTCLMLVFTSCALGGQLFFAKTFSCALIFSPLCPNAIKIIFLPLQLTNADSSCGQHRSVAKLSTRRPPDDLA